MSTNIIHPFPPVYDSRSKLLILGTLPSPKSRDGGFYYGHPQNAFWRVLAAVFEAPVPIAIAEKTAFLLEHNIAIWDVLRSCDISGANDASIKNPIANNFTAMLGGSEIRAVFTNGAKASELYTRLCYKKTRLPALPLPSTSPANRRYYDFDGLVAAYSAIKVYL